MADTTWGFFRHRANARRAAEEAAAAPVDDVAPDAAGEGEGAAKASSTPPAPKAPAPKPAPKGPRTP